MSNLLQMCPTDVTMSGLETSSESLLQLQLALSFAGGFLWGCETVIQPGA